MTILAIIFGTELLGAERGNLEALSALKRVGMNIAVGLSGRATGGGDVGTASRDAGFHTFEMPAGSHFAYSWMRNDRGYRNRQLKRLWTNSKCLLAAIRTHKPDALLLNGTTPFLFCWIALSLSRIPIIYRMGDSPVWESNFQMFLWRNLVRRSSEIVCISKFIQSEVEKGAPKHLSKTRVIYNHPITRHGDIDNNLVGKLIEQKRELQIVYVGQITEQKGVLTLVNSLLELNDDRIGAWIVGGSQHTKKQQNTLKNLILTSTSSTQVEMIDYIQDPRPYYVAADWHIAPSIYPEPLGNIVQEANALSTPSMVSNNGGLPELVEDGIDGIVIEEVSSVGLKAAIIGLFAIQDRWKSMGETARTNLERKIPRKSFDSSWLQVVTDATTK